jgi:hypothetical protein
MIFDDFRKNILKINNKRNHTIKNSIGVRDAYKWCNHNKLFSTKVTEKTFYKIIRTVNNLLFEELVKGNDVKFPQRMGQLEVRKYDTYVKLCDGKIKTNRGIDWGTTLKLWYEDDDAKKNKILLRLEDHEVFKVFYNKMIANYNNKTIYLFKPNRSLSIAIKNAGKKGLIDAYKIGK